MTAKEKQKIIKVWMDVCSIKSSAQSLKTEGDSYDMSFHKPYIRDIIEKCDKIIKLLK